MGNEGGSSTKQRVLRSFLGALALSGAVQAVDVADPSSTAVAYGSGGACGPNTQWNGSTCVPNVIIRDSITIRASASGPSTYSVIVLTPALNALWNPQPTYGPSSPPPAPTYSGTQPTQGPCDSRTVASNVTRDDAKSTPEIRTQPDTALKFQALDWTCRLHASLGPKGITLPATHYLSQFAASYCRNGVFTDSATPRECVAGARSCGLEQSMRTNSFLQGLCKSSVETDKGLGNGVLLGVHPSSGEPQCVPEDQKDNYLVPKSGC